MFKNKFFILLYLLLICTACVTGNALANGFDQNNIGLRGRAMASAFTGVSDDATAIYYNPGGLTSIKDWTWNYNAELIIIFSESLWEDTAGKEHKSDKTVYIPGLFAATSSGDLSYGIGIYVPYGGGSVKYDTGFEATIAYFAATPSIAYKITPTLSAGLGLSVYYGILDMTLPPGVVQLMPVKVKIAFSGISGWGWDGGLMFKPTSELNIGLSVKSQVPIKMKGTADAMGSEYDAEAEFTLPYYYIAGIGYKITPDILIDVDFWYMQWSKMDKISLTVKDVMGTDLKHPLKTYYGNSYDAMIGIEYTASAQLRINAGCKYEKQVASKDEGVNIILNCETDRYTFVAGIGYLMIENLEMVMNFAYIMGVKYKVDTGTYSQAHRAIALGVRGNL